MKVKYFNKMDKIISNLSEANQKILSQVCEKYAFRANDYYLNLIDWNDPNDPIKKIIIPDKQELAQWGNLDASNEASITVDHGIQHKYPYTVLLLCNEVCGGYCRYCFRKRLFMNENDEVSIDVSKGIEYIANNPQVTNVLLTGGDPLLMSTAKIKNIISKLREISHVGIIRIGSKMPAFNPFRIIEDQELLDTFKQYSTPEKKIYVMTHFDHPREITSEATQCINELIKAGVILCNQCPILKGVNDDHKIMAELFRKLSFIGCPPYYVFQGRPTEGNFPYRVPITTGFKIFEEAKKLVSGPARRARFVMSHASGKIEIVSVDEKYIYLKYHRAVDQSTSEEMGIYKRNDEAYWLDDLERVDV